jgi:hypothetical protein
MPSEDTGANGRGQAQEQAAGEVITVMLTRKPWSVSVNAPATEPLACKAALLCAIDELDAQIRLSRVQQLQAQAAENARVAAILAKGKEAFSR